MQKPLLSLFVPRDTHPDAIDAAIGEAFGSPASSMSLDGQNYHYLHLVREGNIVQHVDSGRRMTINALAELLREHCAFVRDSSFQQDQETHELQRI